MAIIWMDGPDHYGTNNALLTGPYADVGQIGLTANSGPGGVGTTFQMGFVNPGSLRKVLPGGRTALGCGARWYFNNLGETQVIYSYRDGDNNEIFRAAVTTTGAIRIINRDGATIAQTDPVIISASWQHIEVFVEFKADGTGKLRIGVDSITIFDSDAIQTVPTHDPAYTLQCASIAIRGFQLRCRDWYLWDTTGALNNSGMQGDRQVVTTYATADTAVDDWAPSAGASGWPLISNVPPDNDDFIAANAPDLTSMFEFGDIDTDITSISAVRVAARVNKSDAGLATIRLRVDSDGDMAEGPEQAVATERNYFSAIFETDPHTDIKWLPGGVNVATFGIHREE